MKYLIPIITFSLIFLSCAKKDEEDTAATSCATDTTASGSITVGSETLSGVYLSGCVDMTSQSGGNIFPSDVKGAKTAVVVTGDTAITEEILMYTDTSCSTPSMTWKQVRSDFTLGSASGSNYAVTYKDASVKVKPSTDVATSHMNALAASNSNITATFTNGTETTVTSSGSTKYNLVLVTSTTVRTGESSDNATPSALDSMEMTKACQ